MAGSKKEMSSFEASFKKLESIVEELENGDSTLEEAMKRFEEGMELIQVCTKMLNDAEARLQKLVRGEDGGFQLEISE